MAGVKMCIPSHLYGMDRKSLPGQYALTEITVIMMTDMYESSRHGNIS